MALEKHNHPTTSLWLGKRDFNLNCSDNITDSVNDQETRILIVKPTVQNCVALK